MSAEPVPVCTLPHVTDVVEGAGLCPDYSAIDPAVLAHAAERGTAVHKAIELYLKGTLDEASLHEEVVPYFEAFRSWHKEQKGFRLIASELWLANETHQGTLDLLCEIDGDVWLIDYKTSQKLTHSAIKAQAGGYADLIEHEDFFVNEVPIPECYGALHLKKTGRFKLHKYEPAECWNLWSSAITIFNARLEEGFIGIKTRR